MGAGFITRKPMMILFPRPVLVDQSTLEWPASGYDPTVPKGIAAVRYDDRLNGIEPLAGSTGSDRSPC